MEPTNNDQMENPWSIVSIDHTLLDLTIVENTARVIGRPTLKITRHTDFSMDVKVELEMSEESFSTIQRIFSALRDKKNK